MMKVYAIIPAGGSGKRIGADTPKQYIKVNGKEIIAYTLEVFQNCSLIDEIAVAAQPDYFPLLNDIKEKYNIDKLRTIIEGGKERQDSVYSALNNINASGNDLVAVHDAARPLLPMTVLENAVNSAKVRGNAVVAVKAKDTLANFDNDGISYIDRQKVYYIQTPQIFSFNKLKLAMEKAVEENFIGTDESSLVGKIGEKINLTEGSSLNFKVTTASDLELFHLINS